MVQHRFYARFIAAREPSFLALVLSFAVAFPANQHREVTFMDTCFHSVIFFFLTWGRDYIARLGFYK